MTLYLGRKRRGVMIMNGRQRGPLIRPGYMDLARLNFARFQVAGVQATGFDGTAWQVFGADVPRFVAPEGRLLIGGQRTNQVRNPRAVGASAPSTFPTNWNALPANGVSVEVVGTGTEAGFAYVDVRFFTPTVTSATASVTPYLNFEANTQIAAALGEVWTGSVFVRRAAGDFTNVTGFGLALREGLSGGSVLIAGSGADARGVSAAVLERIAHTRTLSNASTARINMDLRFSHAAGVAINVTLRLAAPQLELGTFASTPILPPVGTSGASTRGVDILTAPLSSLGIADNGACTVLWRGVVNVANIGTPQVIANIEASVNDRVDIRLGANGLPAVSRVTAGIGQSADFSTAATPGTTIRAGVAVDGAGRVAAVFNGFAGGAVQAVTGAPTTGLTTFRHGSIASALFPLWGETHTLTVLPRVLSDADLQAAVAAL